MSNVHCSDGNAATEYYREMLRFKKMKPRKARKVAIEFAKALPSIMRSLTWILRRKRGRSEKMEALKMIERFAKALREAQIETGITIKPNEAIVIWNDYNQSHICGFKVLQCPSVAGCTLAVEDAYGKFGKLIRTFEDLMMCGM